MVTNLKGGDPSLVNAPSPLSSLAVRINPTMVGVMKKRIASNFVETRVGAVQPVAQHQYN